MRGISKTFAGTQVLRDVDLALHGGEIHALMGENGAGKSTLMKILSGALRADPGSEIRLLGRRVVIDGPRRARALGIAIVHQELALALNLSVTETLFLGRELSRAGLLDRRAMRSRCQALLERLGARFTTDATVAGLSIADRQLVEVARALLAESRILIMDEPTTALSTCETDRLFALLRDLRDAGLALIYISHRMAEVSLLADRVSVLRDGRRVGVLQGEAIDARSIVQLMVGRDIASFYKRTQTQRRQDSALLEARNIGDGRRVHGCSFSVHAGEVLGLAGMVGSGRTELARLVYGADARLSGEVLLCGQSLPGSDPKHSIRAGLAYLTEDRAGLGLYLEMSVSDNINIGVIGADARMGGLLDRRRARERSAAAIANLHIRAPSPAVPVQALSGGNQQKVLLSRWLQTRPRVLILDEPTRGVDIGAKAEIYHIIDELARAGVGLLVISSELPEIVGISDRVLVMREGAIAGELTGQAIMQQSIVALATSSAAPRIH